MYCPLVFLVCTHHKDFSYFEKFFNTYKYYACLPDEHDICFQFFFILVQPIYLDNILFLVPSLPPKKYSYFILYSWFAMFSHPYIHPSIYLSIHLIRFDSYSWFELNKPNEQNENKKRTKRNVKVKSKFTFFL